MFFRYDKEAPSAKQKKSFWSEDQEETLSRVFRQLKEGEGGEGIGAMTPEGGDVLDAITAHFVETGKSRRQVAKKLKDMGLIQVLPLIQAFFLDSTLD